MKQLSTIDHDLPSSNNSKGSGLILFAGDSLTEGLYGVSYVNRVAEAVANGPVLPIEQIVNAGYSGDTVASLLARMDSLLEEYQPLWVVVAIGTNDIWYRWITHHSLGWWLWVFYRRLRYGQKPTADIALFGAQYREILSRAQRGGLQGSSLHSPTGGGEPFSAR